MYSERIQNTDHGTSVSGQRLTEAMLGPETWAKELFTCLDEASLAFLTSHYFALGNELWPTSGLFTLVCVIHYL